MKLQKVTFENLETNDLIHSYRFSLNSNLGTTAIDPIATAKIIDVGIILFKLFSNKDDSFDKIGNWIVELSGKLKKIAEDLNDIKKELQELKILYRESEIKEAEITLLSAIDTYKQHIFNLKEQPDNRDYLNTFRDLYFQQISICANKLKRYSYAAVYTLGYALKVELDLITALKLGVFSRKGVLEDYINYFSNSLNQNIEGSIGNILNALSYTRKDLLSQFHDDSVLFKDFQYFGKSERVCELGDDKYAPCWTEYELITIKLYYRISGNLENGFTGTLIELDESDKSIEYGVRKGDVDAFGNESLAISYAQKYFEERQLARYNSQVSVYNIINKKYEMLKEVEKTCYELINICKLRLSEIKD